MNWKTKFETGEPEIDRQHRALLSASSQFRSTLNIGGGKVTYDLFLDFLQVYARAHISYEKNLIASQHCLLKEPSKTEHDEFFEQLYLARFRYMAVGFQRNHALTLLDALDRWLESHIKVSRRT